MYRSINKLSIALVLAAALSLGGCFKISKSLPADAPSYVKVYPGAGQVITVDVAGMKAVVFQAPATPTDVVAFYRIQAQAAQMPESPAPAQANAPAGTVSATFGDMHAGQFLVVSARPQAQGSMVSLTYKPGPAAPASGQP